MPLLAPLCERRYESKQLDGGPLAALVEALAAGSEYLDESPLAAASAAFELEFDVLLCARRAHSRVSRSPRLALSLLRTGAAEPRCARRLPPRSLRAQTCFPSRRS